MTRFIRAILATVLLALTAACAEQGYVGPHGIFSNYGSQTVAGMNTGGPPTASAGGNAIH